MCLKASPSSRRWATFHSSGRLGNDGSSLCVFAMHLNPPIKSSLRLSLISDNGIGQIGLEFSETFFA